MQPRSFYRLSLAVAMAWAVSTPSASTTGPGAARSAEPAPVVGAGHRGDWFFLREPSLARHAKVCDSLRSRGFRMLSLDLYGDSGRPAAAAAWIRGPGPAWIHLEGVPSALMRDTLSVLSERGYRPALLSGSPDGSLFAAVLEKDSTPATASFDLAPDGFRAACDSAQRNGAILAWADAYGTPDHPLFAGVWKRNDAGVPWNYSIGDAQGGLAAKAEAFEPVWVRPSLQLPYPGGRFFTLWEENSIGPWAVSIGVAGTGLDDTLARAERDGFHPLRVHADERSCFTVLLARRADPLPKLWSVTGPEEPALSAFDDYMRDLMQRHQVRAGALALVKDGRLAFAHGYTWAEEGYPRTQPASLFRIASCSKPLASMVLFHQLREAGLPGAAFTLQEKVLSLLPRKDAPGAQPRPVDPRFDDVTIDDLLTHAGGWVRSRDNPDPVFNDFPAGSGIRNRLPEARENFLTYMLGQPLQFAPGSKSCYANFGYFLLGRIIESAPMNLGRNYEQIATDLLFKPLGLARPRFGGSLMRERLDGEVLYHTRAPYLQKGRDPGGPAWVPGAYGDFDLRNMDAAGAWVMSAVDYAKILASFDLGDANPIMPSRIAASMWSSPRGNRFLRGWFSLPIDDSVNEVEAAQWHNGLYPGTSTMVFHLPGRFSFVLFLDRDIKPELSGEKQGRELSRLAARVDWPDTDCFPNLGIAANAPADVVGEAPGSEAWHPSSRRRSVTDQIR